MRYCVTSHAGPSEAQQGLDAFGSHLGCPRRQGLVAARKRNGWAAGGVAHVAAFTPGVRNSKGKDGV